MTEIVETDGVMGGQPRLADRRISVLQVAEWVLDDGMAPETVSTEFNLELADVHRALAYYYDNVERMNRLRERRRRRIEESRETAPSPPVESK